MKRQVAVSQTHFFFSEITWKNPRPSLKGTGRSQKAGPSEGPGSHTAGAGPRGRHRAELRAPLGSDVGGGL